MLKDPLYSSHDNFTDSEREASLQNALVQAVNLLATRAEVICVREPLVDQGAPNTSDLDLLVFADVAELLPERLVLDAPSSSGRTPLADLIWLPTDCLDNPMALAGNGLIAHRLATSRLVHAHNELQFHKKMNAVSRMLFDKEVQANRISGFMEMGFLAVREVGVTWNFPAMALFWLHMAHAACIAGILDAGRIFCPNVYTKPMAYVRKASELVQDDLEKIFCENLRLNAFPPDIISRLRRIHAAVYEKFPEPVWPEVMRATTRYEYRYFRDPEELNWRITAAEEMANKGDKAAAVFYLRFWAYCLARVPMVYHRALESIDVSFVRPERSILPELKKYCPEIIDDLSAVLAPEDFGSEEVEDILPMLDPLRLLAARFAGEQGIAIRSLRSWQPFRPRDAEATG